MPVAFVDAQQSAHLRSRAGNGFKQLRLHSHRATSARRAHSKSGQLAKNEKPAAGDVTSTLAQLGGWRQRVRLYFT
jgi:hypothetical protein